MKTKILLLFFFSIFFLNAWAQTSFYHPFPDSNAVWNGHSSWEPFKMQAEDYSYIMSGDTIIGLKTYHKIYIPFLQVTGDTSSPVHFLGYQGCLRNNIATRQTFFINAGSSVEKLLYDFSLNPGDPVPTLFPKYGGIGGNFIVQNIDSVLVGSDYRKRWHCADTNFYGSWSFIEGIGYKEGLLDIACEGGIYCLDPVYFVYLTCFKQNDSVLYHPFSSFSCDAVTDVKNIEGEKYVVNIFPNPVISSFTLQITTQLIDAEAIISDMLGKEMMRKSFSGNEVQIEKGKMESGVYFVKVKAREKEWVEKLMVE